jgi:hypothetical protein
LQGTSREARITAPLNVKDLLQQYCNPLKTGPS